MKRIILFLISTFTLTYLTFGGLAYLTTNNYVDFYSVIGQVLFILGGTSPTIFAFVFVFHQSDDKTKEDFKNKLFSYKHPIPLWIYAIFLPLIIGGIFQLIYILFYNHSFDSSIPFYFFILTFMTSIIFGGIEEIGWRGFLQDQIMKKFKMNLIFISILIGIVWGFWHLPLFFVEEASHYTFKFLPFLLGAIMFSTYLTWLYAKTRSILLVVILHASINASANIGIRIEFEHTVLAYVIMVGLTLIGFWLLYTQQISQKLEPTQKKVKKVIL